MQTVNVGHKIQMAILYLDTNGNPMQTTVAPDSAPTWTNSPSDPGVDTLTVAPDGNSAELAALATGTDTVTLTVVVGGTTYTATLTVNVTPAPQVLGSVDIQATVV